MDNLLIINDDFNYSRKEYIVFELEYSKFLKSQKELSNSHLNNNKYETIKWLNSRAIRLKEEWLENWKATGMSILLPYCNSGLHDGAYWYETSSGTIFIADLWKDKYYVWLPNNRAHKGRVHYDYLMN